MTYLSLLFSVVMVTHYRNSGYSCFKFTPLFMRYLKSGIACAKCTIGECCVLGSFSASFHNSGRSLNFTVTRLYCHSRSRKA